MATFIRDADVERRLQSERAATGADRYDEVWEGTYMMAPMPNDRHQQIVSRLVSILEETMGWPGHGEVRPGVNVSDRDDDWQQNYRVPDVAVFLKGGGAVNRGAFWKGGPDFVVEVISAGDSTREKMPFYGRVGVKELLVIDREPWRLELLRLDSGRLVHVANASLEEESTAGETLEEGSVEDRGDPLTSDVVPLTFRLRVGVAETPRIEVTHAETARVWLV